MKRLRLMVLTLLGLYALQVVASLIAMAIPARSFEHENILVVGRRGISTALAFVPILGLLWLSGDGNRLQIYVSGEMKHEESIDLFDDIDWSAIKVNAQGDTISVSDGRNLDIVVTRPDA